MHLNTLRGIEMKRIEIGQEPYATTLLSVIKGISDYYNLDYSRAFVYGASAHAFLINIHNQLCPSGPYCWNGPWLEKQLKLMGLNMTDLGFYHNESKAEERTELEVKIKRFIDKDIPCSVLNLDNQIVCGYDDDGLLFVQPWKGFDDSTPARLTYGTWKEFKGEIHVSFQAYESFEPATKYEIVKQSLITAVEILENGDKYQFDNYALGLKAYDYFLEAFETQSMGHGCWWNANVWENAERWLLSTLLRLKICCLS